MTDFPILSAAQVEYDQAVDWYLTKRLAAVNRFVAEVESALEFIRADPERYPRWDDTYRFYILNEFPYYVAYRHTSDVVVIVAIRHSAQDQGAWQGR
jgi:plasmid stabilization system protein ParE